MIPEFSTFTTTELSDVEAPTLESEVRFYCRLFPATFSRAAGSFLFDVDGREYLDFFSGSGSLNYGHSNPVMKRHILEYIEKDGIINSLDQLTEAKLFFMQRFHDIILKPREMDYKMQFCGPTGANSVEAAIKLARKYTGRLNIVHFEYSFHGMSAGAMSVSGMKNMQLPSEYRKLVVEMPFGDVSEHIDVLRSYLDTVPKEEVPAAIIFEPIQAEGGMRVAADIWMQNVAELSHEYGIILIVDDIQAGCGRTGNFFSFEQTGIQPDIICLSKSLSGYGFPLSMNLLNPKIDCWRPAEHNGTFRGNNLAFVAGAHVLRYWEDKQLSNQIAKSNKLISAYFSASKHLSEFPLKGKGLMLGIELPGEEIAGVLQRQVFRNGLLMDLCGPNDTVLKIMPALTIGENNLTRGLEIIERSVSEILS